MADTAHSDINEKKCRAIVPALALISAFLVLVFDGGISATSLICATTILLIGYALLLRRSCRPTWPGLLLFAILLYGLLSILPIPDSILKIAGTESSSHHSLARAALEESRTAGVITSASGWFQISRNKAGTTRALLLLITALTAGTLARQIPKSHRTTLLLATGIAASLIGIAGLVSLHILPQEKTFWWSIPVMHGKPVACFINRNHFGGFLAVVGCIMYGLTCSLFSKRRVIPATIAAASFLVCSIAAVGSFSRGSLLALASGLLACLALNIRKRPIPAIALLALLIAVSALGMSTGTDNTLRSRIATLANPTDTLSARLRLDTWGESLAIMKSYPVFGTGLNAFRSVYPQHRITTTRKEPNNVENEYIQLPVETGLTGTLLIAATLIMFAIPFFRRKGEQPELLSIILPGLITVLAHCMVDFAIRIPLYSFVLATFTGLCISPAHEIRPRPGLRFIMPATLAVAVIILIIASTSIVSTFNYDSPDYLKRAAPEELAAAVMSSPSYWQVYYNLGRIAAHSPEHRAMAERHIATASRLDPHNYNLLLELAKLRLDMGMREDALQAYREAKSLRAWLNISALEVLLRETDLRPAEELQSVGRP